MSAFFNFSTRQAGDWWDRRAFLRSWWRISSRDRRWAPLSYRLVARAMVAQREPHLDRYGARAMLVEAMPRRSGSFGFAGAPIALATDEHVVGTLLPLPLGAGDAESLGLAFLTFANDEEALDRLLGAAWERAAEAGCSRLVGPVEITPSFSYGALLDHFDAAPPLHTPYNAPYVPDLLAGTLEPCDFSRLWHLDAGAAPGRVAGPAGLTVEPLRSGELAAGLLHLTQAALARPEDSLLPPPDACEVEFVLRIWGAASPLIGWQAVLDGHVVGFALAQADTGPALRRLKGGYSLWARAWMAARPPRRGPAGRILLGAVDPEARGMGVGTRLLAQVLDHARAHGWGRLAIGPVFERSDGENALRSWGAVARQRYALFASEE